MLLKYCKNCGPCKYNVQYSVLPTNLKNFLLDQPKNFSVFQWFIIQSGKEKLSKPVYRPSFWQEI
jgi:hypothetical protein